MDQQQVFIASSKKIDGYVEVKLNIKSFKETFLDQDKNGIWMKYLNVDEFLKKNKEEYETRSLMKEIYHQKIKNHLRKSKEYYRILNQILRFRNENNIVLTHHIFSRKGIFIDEFLNDKRKHKHIKQMILILILTLLEDYYKFINSHTI